MEAASGRLSNTKERSARLEVPERAPFLCLAIPAIGELSKKLNRTSNAALNLKPFFLLLPTIAMGNCFPLSPFSFCFLVPQIFTPRILLQGSPIHAADPSVSEHCRKMVAQRLPAVERLNMVLHKL